MGLFSSIGNLVSKAASTVVAVGKTLVSDVKGGLNLLSAVAVKPVTTVKAVASYISNPSTATANKVVSAVKTVENRSAGQNIVSTVVNTGVAAAAVIGAGAAATEIAAVGIVPAITSVVQKLVPTTVKGALVETGLIAGGIVATSAVMSSDKIQNAVEDLPSNLAGFGAGIGKTIQEPTLENGLALLKEHPGLSAAAAAALLVAAGYGVATVANIISNYQNTSAVRANTAATNASSILPSTQPASTTVTPVTPATVPLASDKLTTKATTKKKAKKKKKKVTKKVKKKKSVKKKKKTTKKRKKKRK
jgi:hypothetical protein